MIVRNANSDDLDRIIELSIAFCDEAPTFKKHGFNPESAYDPLLYTIGNDAAWVVEHDGFIVGFMLGASAVQWYSGQLVASDLALYVIPEHRKSDAAALLIAAFDAWARKIGATMALCGNSTGNSNGAIARYSNAGFKQVGAVVAKEYV